MNFTLASGCAGTGKDTEMHNPFRAVAAVVALGFALAGPVQAQENPLVAEVNGVKIML